MRIYRTFAIDLKSIKPIPSTGSRSIYIKRTCLQLLENISLKRRKSVSSVRMCINCLFHFGNFVSNQRYSLFGITDTSKLRYKIPTALNIFKF